MVLPGWNVTEPLQVAARFCEFVQAYRGAPYQIRNFASEVDAFRVALKALESCLNNPASIPPNDLTILKNASEGRLRRCAEDCQKFVDGFFKSINAPARDEIGAGNRLNWIWKEKEAAALKQDMNSQVTYILLHLSVAQINDQQRRTSTTSETSPAIAPASTPAIKDPLTPSALFQTDQERKSETFPSVAENFPQIETINSADFPQAKARSSSVTPTSDFSASSEGLWSHLADHLPPEILQRRGSESSIFPAFSTETMEDLSGVAISYRPTESSGPLPVQKLEFLKDSSGTLLYIIATPPQRFKAKVFQKISLSSQAIPHTEHPRAYNNRETLQIKFLEPHQVTSQRWSQTNSNSSTRSVGTSSNRDIGTHSIHGTPDTISSAASFISSTSLGSPLLSAAACKFVDETRYPKYYFELANDYKKFQEIVIGKTLLLNAPVDLIVFKQPGMSEIQEECEKQYLQLWTDGRSQTIMYLANLSGGVPRYLQHNIESFKPNDTKSTPTTLRLNFKQPGISSPVSSERQGSVKSILSSPTMSFMLSGKCTELHGTPPGYDMSEGINSKSYRAITFTKAKDKTAFLDKAEFFGITDAQAIPPFAFQQPSF